MSRQASSTLCQVPKSKIKRHTNKYGIRHFYFGIFVVFFLAVIASPSSNIFTFWCAFLFPFFRAVCAVFWTYFVRRPQNDFPWIFHPFSGAIAAFSSRLEFIDTLANCFQEDFFHQSLRFDIELWNIRQVECASIWVHLMQLINNSVILFLMFKFYCNESPNICPWLSMSIHIHFKFSIFDI